MLLRKISLRVVVFSLLLVLTFTAQSSAQVTTPESFLGYKPGADFKLTTYEKSLEYFELVASQTDRVQIFQMGVTSAGRPMKYAVISSEENMAKLDYYKEIMRKLTFVGDLSDEEAKSLADEGKAVVWIDGGLHGTEVAPPQLLPQLLYDVATAETRLMKSVREDVITLIVFANPDGMTIVSDWYMSNVGTPYEVSPTPWLYHKYVGHDNNRDSFMSNLIETQNMNIATSKEWTPVILYNQHQTGPFPARIWIPPEAEPTNPNVHPLIIRWKNLIGSAMGKLFDEEGKSGVISRVRYDSWYPGYVTQIVDGRNTISILTETQLYKYATPQFFNLNDFPEDHKDLAVGTFYPNPWKGGWWRLGDAVAYNRTACWAVLETAAKYKYELLYNKYIMGADAIARFKAEPPYGWILPTDQVDPASTELLVNRMMVNGLEVYTADEAFSHNGIKYTKGSFVLPTSQPYGLLLKNLFEVQDYPDLRKYSHLWEGLVGPEPWEGGPLRAYDGVGWTLPMQMGVKSAEMASVLDVPMTHVTEDVVAGGTVSGSGSQYVMSHSDNNSFKALYKLLDAGATAGTAETSFTLGGKRYEKGAFVVNTGRVSGSRVREIATETGAFLQSGKPASAVKSIKKPRVALYTSWVASMDGGWMTYIFDQYGYDVHALTNAEVLAGSLNDRFDAIILPDQRTGQIVNGHKKGTIPPDYAGGLGETGVGILRQFVEAGGTLVCNNGSTDLPMKYFNLPIKNVLSGVPADSFNCPGAILKIDYDLSNPLAYGMAEQGMAYFSRGSVFEVTEEPNEESGVSIKAVGTYPDESLLMSGWMIGDEIIRGKAGVLDVTMGKGKLFMFGYNIHNRSQAYSTFKLLFNALYYK